MAEKDKGATLRITTDGSGAQGGQEGIRDYPSFSEIAGIFFPLNGKDFKSALFKNLVALGSGPAFFGSLRYWANLEVSNEVLIYSAALGPACIALARGLDLWAKYSNSEAIAARMKRRELSKVQRARKDDERLDSMSGDILTKSTDEIIRQALTMFLGFNLTRKVFGKVPGEELKETWQEAHLRASSLSDDELKKLMKRLGEQSDLLAQMASASFLIDVVEAKALASNTDADNLPTQNSKDLLKDLINFYEQVYLPARQGNLNRREFIESIIAGQRRFPRLEGYDIWQLEGILKQVGEYLKVKEKREKNGEEYLDSLQYLIATLISCPCKKDDLKVKAMMRAYSSDENVENFRNFLLLLTMTDGIMGGLEVLRVMHPQTWSKKGSDDWIDQLSKEATYRKLTEIINSLFPPENPLIKIILNVFEKISDLSAERDLSPLFSHPQLQNELDSILSQIRQMMLAKEDPSFYVLGALTAAQQLFNNLKASRAKEFLDTLSPIFFMNFLAYLSLGVDQYRGLSHPSTSINAINKKPSTQQKEDFSAEESAILSVIMAIAKVTFNNLEKHFSQRPWLLEVLFDEAKKPDGFLNKLKTMPNDKFWENNEISHFLGNLLEIVSGAYEQFSKEGDNEEYKDNIKRLQEKVAEIIISHITYLVVADTDEDERVIFPIGNHSSRQNLETILRAFPKSPTGEQRIDFSFNADSRQIIEHNGQQKNLEAIIGNAYNLYTKLDNPGEKLISQEEIIFSTMLYIFSTLSAQISNFQDRIGNLEKETDQLERDREIIRDLANTSRRIPSIEAINTGAGRKREELNILRAKQETINSLIVNTLLPYFRGLFAGTNVDLNKVMLNQQNELILQMSILL